jgi:hypothetical protein
VYQLERNEAHDIVTLKLIGDVSFKEFIDINAMVVDVLNELNDDVILVIDLAQGRNLPFPNGTLKSSQAYAQHPRLNSIIVLTDNKLFRLSMLLMFSAVETRVQFFESLGKAQGYLQNLRGSA